MKYNTLDCENKNGILIIRIDREDKMNALNMELLGELRKVVETVRNDASIIGAILTGKGQKAFAAGADIAEFAAYNESNGAQMSRSGHEIFRQIETCPKPFIACVNGFSLGGGCELAMACHMRIASDNARFGQPEVNLGIIPGYGGTQRLIQYIGKGKALELLCTGDMIAADEAERLGLVNHVTDLDGLIPKAEEIILKIAKKAPLAIAKVIDCVDAYFSMEKDGFETEIEQFASCMSTADFREGTTAFVEKRKAHFQGK